MQYNWLADMRHPTHGSNDLSTNCSDTVFGNCNNLAGCAGETRGFLDVKVGHSHCLRVSKIVVVHEKQHRHKKMKWLDRGTAREISFSVCESPQEMKGWMDLWCRHGAAFPTSVGEMRMITVRFLNMFSFVSFGYGAAAARPLTIVNVDGRKPELCLR